MAPPLRTAAAPYHRFAFPLLLLTTLSGTGCGEGAKPADAGVTDAGSSPDGTGVDGPTVAALRINELCPDNDGLLIDEDGQADDWIELLNADTVPVDLAGWVLGEGSKHKQV